MFRNILSTLLIISILSVCSSGQELTSYGRVEALSGQQLDLPVSSTNFPEFLKYPANGTAAKFKYGYESVFRIRYTSSPNFVGLDTIIYQTQRSIGGRAVPHFEGFVIHVRQILINDDYYAISLHQNAVALDVLENDISNLGEVTISEITHVSNGSAELTTDRDGIRFTPVEAGFASIGYLACSGNHCASANIQIRIDDFQSHPKADTLRYVIERDQEVTILVGPGFSEPSSTYYLGSLSRESSQIFRYQPRLGFTGTEVLKFQQIYQGQKILHIATVEVVDPFISNGWNRDDQIYTEVDNGVEFSVLGNDLGGAIDVIYDNDLQGNLVNLGSGQYYFQPEPGFNGKTHFSYRSCADGRCDMANVFITVHNYEPLSDRVHWFTTKNGSLHIDYKVPIDQYHFEVLSAPQNGTVEMSQDAKAFSYEPLAGFVGSDQMTIRYCCQSVDAEDCKVIYAEVHVQDIEIVEHCMDCIWPGDHNNDGMVDIQDAVVLTTNLGATGPQRNHTDNGQLWYGEFGHWWPAGFSYGVDNLKYVDGNGDGMITVKDLQVINQYYEFAHGLVATAPPGHYNTPLHLDLITPEVQSGEWAIIEVSLGNSNAQVDEMLGLNFSFEVSERFVDSSSVQFNISQHGIFTPLNSVVAWAKSSSHGRIDVGIGKTDRQPISGHGVLGEIRFIVEEDLNGFRSLKDLIEIPMAIRRISLMDGSGSLTSIPEVGSHLSLVKKQPVRSLTLHPNPASDWIRLSHPVASYEIIDINGVSILQSRTEVDDQINIRSLTTGVYLLRSKGLHGEASLLKFEVVR